MAPSSSSAWLKSQSAARSTLPLHACGSSGRQVRHQVYIAQSPLPMKHAVCVKERHKAPVKVGE